MNWNLIEFDTFNGKYNMDYDLQLVKNCNPEIPILRFYGWTPYCISIGANQSYEEISREKCNSDDIDIVKRPTGGRAILHAEELTYSVVISSNDLSSSKKLYEDISNAIVFGLHLYHPLLQKVELENASPNFPALLKEPSGTLCFASTAKNEIKFKGKKIVGSAQRKLGSTILQHGSILIGDFHRNLIDYLAIENKTELENELSDKTIEIESIINEKVDIITLQKNIITGFEKVFGAVFSVPEPEVIS